MTADSDAFRLQVSPDDRHRVEPLGAALAVLAGLWHACLMTSASNDNFAHMTLAKQWLAGDWPVSDFFDQGWVLQYALSAAAQAVGGDRLMSEAVVVGVAWAISTYLVFVLVRGLTSSRGAAALAAFLLIAAGARGYSYPKGIVYAVAATLWWAYVRKPTRRGAVGLGAWTAVAFYWRPDHGIYVAVAVALAVLSAHGPGLLSAARSALAGATALAIVAPFLVYVHATVGLPEYLQTGLAAAEMEHTTHGPHAWPLLRLAGRVLPIEPADRYAPIIGIRWSPESLADARRELLARYGLSPVESDGLSERVRLSASAVAELRRLINEPIVEDTTGIDRSTGELARSAWPTSERWAFNHAWLRARFLPDLDGQARASEVAAALFYALPVLLVAAAARIAPFLAEEVTPRRLAAWAAVALMVVTAMLRIPFPARVPDAVVPSAIVLGLLAAGLWRSAGVAKRTSVRGVVRAGVAALALLAAASVSASGRFAERAAVLAGNWTSMRAVRAAWSDVYAELASSPPLQHYVGRRARFSLRLAAYVRDCVPQSERVVVLWFEPEVYYYSDRLMAQRHVVFATSWALLDHEQRLTLEKVRRFQPPIVLARLSALDPSARASYPGVVDYVEREYRVGATAPVEGEEYLIYVRRDRAPLRTFGDEGWPCFVPGTSQWSRVGEPG